MKTLHIDFKVWTGDTLYYIKDSTIEETWIRKVEYEFKNTSDQLDRNYTLIKYTLGTGAVIHEKDLEVKYFTDKKELVQKLIAQL